MNDKINEFKTKAMQTYTYSDCDGGNNRGVELNELKFAKLIIAECLNIIEQYPIPIGNSPVGELAAEWTYDALEQIRDTIKETFEVTDEPI